MARVVVVGAGVVGAACAYHLARDGHRVTVLDRSAPGMGTTSRGEGNILVSDKEPGPELDLALWSQRRWRELAEELSTDFEWEPKGGLVVATTDAALGALRQLAAGQRRSGVAATEVRAADLHVLRTAPGRRVWPAACTTRRTSRCSRCSPPRPCCTAQRGAPRGDPLRRRGHRRGDGARWESDRRAHQRRPAARRRRGQCRRHLGWHGRDHAGRPGPGTAATRVRPGHRAAPAGGPAQGVLGGLRRQRGLERRRAGDLRGGRGHPGRHRTDRREPGTRRLRRRHAGRRRAADWRRRQSGCSRCWPTSR